MASPPSVTGATTATLEQSAPQTPNRKSGLRSWAQRLDWRDHAIYLGFLAVFILFAITLGDNGFLTGSNLLNIVRQTAVIAVMAVAGTFVIAAAQIDLSIGSVAGLSSVITAMTLSGTDNVGMAVLAGLCVGLGIGLVNGVLVAYARIPSFLVTLAMLGIASGIAQWISNFQPVPILDRAFTTIFGSGDLGPFPSLLIWALLFVIAGVVVMNKTAFGRRVLAVGGNAVAASFSGVRVRRVTFTVLVVSAVVASIAGMLYAGRLQSGRYQWGTGDELSVIAAVVLGGTSLFGGTGRITGSVVGAVFVGLINNGLVLAGLDASQQIIIQGAIIILAVALTRKR